MQKLPELSEKVFVFLDTSSVLECRLVCRAFNHIIENPHFWLKNLSFDGTTRTLHKLTETIVCFKRELNAHDCTKITKYFYRNVWSNDNENQFYGTWHYRLFIISGMGNCTVSYLEDNFNKFLTKWRQVIINQKEMNLTFDKSHLLYLIKFFYVIHAHHNLNTSNVSARIAKCRKLFSDVSFLIDHYVSLARL